MDSLQSTHRKLEIGPGENPLGEDWEIVDMVPRPGSSAICAWGEDDLPFEEGVFDVVYASHVLEHVPWHQTTEALVEALRVLKPGGVLEVWVPDFQKIVDAYVAKRCVDPWRRFNPNGDYMLSVNGRIFTYGPGAENYHRAVFDAEYLRSCLVHAGFVEIQRLTEPRGYDHGFINLGMSGRKVP